MKPTKAETALVGFLLGSASAALIAVCHTSSRGMLVFSCSGVHMLQSGACLQLDCVQHKQCRADVCQAGNGKGFYKRHRWPGCEGFA